MAQNPRPGRELRISVGVIAEKRKPKSVWAEDYWLPVAILYGHSHHRPGEVIRQDEVTTVYFMGFTEIFCHAVETEAYVHNFESAVPAVYVVLRKDEENAHPLPWYVHCVTVSPYEAQDFSDNGTDIVERVQMQEGIAVALTEFIDANHVEQVFRKRRRIEIRIEDEKFGKEPIYEVRRRLERADDDDG